MVDLNNKHLCNQEKTEDDGFDSERKRNQLKFTKDDRYLKESSIICMRQLRAKLNSISFLLQKMIKHLGAD